MRSGIAGLVGAAAISAALFGAAVTEPGAADAATPAAKRLQAQDDFSGTKVGSNAWDEYRQSPGEWVPGGNGQWAWQSPSRLKEGGGLLTVTGESNGLTGGMAWTTHAAHRNYGIWSARVRMPRGCACYHPVLLLTSVGSGSKQTAEIDLMEVFDNAGRNEVEFNTHLPNGNNGPGTRKRIDLTQWHTFSVEVTSVRITGWVDGKQWFTTTDKAVIPHQSLTPSIQLDYFPEETRKHTGASMQVDWIRAYSV